MKFEVSIEKEKVDKTLKDLEEDVVFQNIKRQAEKIKSEKLGFASGQTGLKRHLGWFDIMAITVCAVVGMGIFIKTFSVQTTVLGIGDAVPLAFLVGAIPALFTTLCYASLASALPREGGDYIFISRGLHPFFAFWITWTKWIGSTISMGVIAFISADLVSNMLYVFGVSQSVLNSLKSPIGKILLTLLILSGCYWINLRGGKYFKVIIRVFFFIILFGSIAIILLLTFHYDYESFITAATQKYGEENFLADKNIGDKIPDSKKNNFIYSLKMLLSAASVLFFAYLGFDTAVTMSGETKDPRKNIPKGIIYAILLIIVLYFIISLGFYSFIPWKYVAGYLTLHPEAQPSDFINISPYPYEIILVSFIIAIALISDIPPWMMAVSRIFFAWSFDGIMPKKFSKLNQYGIPIQALNLTYLLAVVVVIECQIKGISLMLELDTIAMLFTYTLVNMTMLLLPLKKPLYYNIAEFKLGKFNNLVSGIGIFTTFLLLGMLISTSFNSFIVFCILMTLGSLIFIYNYKKKIEKGIDMETTFKILPPE
ncbi:MAG TPA: APC family permease [Methanosarcinales archaeon]|nr:APC family permease [Methanosarcinales archaeon]